jgi:beta-lactamase regulating signal transducer with metallopeptidase domain
MMGSLNSWLSPNVMHALGWALIHSLWQCLGVAALAAAVMVLFSRPALRYVIAVGALALMLAAPVATFSHLMRPIAPDHAFVPAHSNGLIFTEPGIARKSEGANSVAASSGTAPSATSTTVSGRPAVFEKPASALEDFSNHILPGLLPGLVAAWLCGVAFFSLRFAGGFLLLEHKRRTQSALPGQRLLAICQDMQRQLGLDRAIRYLECRWLQAPAVIGWLRPIVLLPVSALTGLSEDQLRAVIAHELAHIWRLDAFVNLFQVLVETLLFFHPAVWWLNKRIRAERELCCDEIAVSLTGNRLAYAQALTLMAEWEQAPILTMAINHGPLSQRVFHILGRKSSGVGQRMLGFTGSALLLIAALAAANTLFGIAAPPMAQAKENLKAALSSVQIVGHHQAEQARATDTKSTTPDKNIRDQAVSPETTTAKRNDPLKDSQAEKLMPPTPDLSRLLPRESLATPTVLASNAPPAATSNDAPAGAAPMPAEPVVSPQISSEPPTIVRLCSNNHVTGRAVSSSAIQVSGFFCYGYDEGNLRFGPVALNLQLADPADANKLRPGTLVTVYGNFRVARKQHVDYLIALNARVEADPFGRSVPDQIEPGKNSQPADLSPASLTNRPASNDLGVVTQCRNRNVFGLVISPNAIRMQGFSCIAGGPGDVSGFYGSRMEYGSCPYANDNDSRPDLTSADRLNGSVLRACRYDVNMNVSLADATETNKMQLGHVVELTGDFHITKRNRTDYLTVDNAEVLEIGPSKVENVKGPALLVCEASQLTALSNQLGQRLCVQSDIIANLNRAKPDLEAAAHSLVDHTAQSDRSDDPNGIICHKRLYVRLPSSVTCAYNSYWAFAGTMAPTGGLGDTPMPGEPNQGSMNSGPMMIGGAIWNGR